MSSVALNMSLKRGFFGRHGSDTTAKKNHFSHRFSAGLRGPGDLDPYAGAYYDVKVLQVFKGNPKSELRLFSENSTARFWLEVGSDYILFISEESFDPPIGVKLTADTCGNSAGINDAHATVHALQGLSKGN